MDKMDLLTDQDEQVIDKSNYELSRWEKWLIHLINMAKWE